MAQTVGVWRKLHIGTLGLAALPWSLGAGLAQTASPEGAIALPEIEVVATSPLPGSGENRDKIPAQVQTVPAEDFARTNSPSVTDTLQQQVPAAVSIDINGNPFSQALFYRGFQASPLQGTPQGLAVYENGIRVNEVFGDTVNWDLIPPQAIYSADVFTNNPIFGLNALGGAVSLQMKNGFLWQGFTTQVMGGSFGRVSGQFEYGKLVEVFTSRGTRQGMAAGGIFRRRACSGSTGISATARKAMSFILRPRAPAPCLASSARRRWSCASSLATALCSRVRRRR
jgi:iron complex outermembrane recepter protein